MRRSALARVVSATAVLLLLVGGGAASAAPSSQTLSLMVKGGTVSDLGTQNYKVQGGQLWAGMVDGFPLNPATTTLDYSMSARVNGLDTNGNAHIHLTSQISGGSPTEGVTWSATAGTFDQQHQKCDKPEKNGQMRCDAQFTADGAGVVVVTATYPGDPNNSPSSGSFTIFVGNLDSSTATSTSLVCDQSSLQVGQRTNCHATVNTADSSAEDAGVTWSVSPTTAGTFDQQHQKCDKPEKNGQMRCDAQFTAATAGPVTITAAYTPNDPAHASSSGSYTAFVGYFGPSTATATSLTCDQATLDSGEHTNCHATVATPYGGANLTVDANVKISSQVGSGVPLGCDAPGSTIPCNSELPAFFVGASNIRVNVGDGHAPQSPDMKVSASDDHAPPSQPGPQAPPVQMMLESPYFNPWGAAIVMASTDGSVFLAANYSVGTIEWTGTTVTGPVVGTLGSVPLTGTFNMVSHEMEDLVAGTAQDSGRVNFTGMSVPSLNIQGRDFSGATTAGESFIPQPGSKACAAEAAVFGMPCVTDCTPDFANVGLPTIPGSCTSTGFQSNGTMKMNGGPLSINGTYTTTWSNPALFFVSVIQAKVTRG